jgi:hypothetical protein
MGYKASCLIECALSSLDIEFRSIFLGNKNVISLSSVNLKTMPLTINLYEEISSQGIKVMLSALILTRPLGPESILTGDSQVIVYKTQAK